MRGSILSVCDLRDRAEGKRFFKMTPIHLHFELLGWSETQVVQRFWLIGLMAALIGIGLSQV